MRTSNFLRKTIVFVIPLSLALAGSAQNAPIGCDSKFFVSYGSSNNSTSQTTINQLTISGGTVTGNAFAATPTTIGFNAIGLNPIDGYMYGMRYPASSERVRLVKIGLGTPNNINDLGEVNNASGSQLIDGAIAYAGCFDATGAYYFITTNNRFFSIPSGQLNNAAGQRNATYITTLTAPDYFVDIAIDPTNGQMYGLTVGSDYGLYTINRTSGATVRLGTYPNSGSPMIGAFFTENGSLYAYRSNGAFFLLNKSNGSGSSAGTGPSYQFADGCSCSFRVGHDLDAPPSICPTVQNGGQPGFNFTLSVQNSSGAARSGTTYTLILSNRFTFTQTAAVIAANFAAAGMTNSGAVITSVSSGTNNQLVVNNVTIPNLSAVPNVLIAAKLVNHIGFTTAAFQSVISGLPAGIGGTDASNDPKTPAPDDATVIGRCPGTILGVKLLSFSGNYKNDITQLNWQTENEENFDHFEIERSTDGSNFSAVGREQAKGTSGSKETYGYGDNLSSERGNIFYYRLKILDVDGMFSYSSIILVRREQKMSNALTISPNPVYKGGPVTVTYSTNRAAKAELRVLDMNGKIVLRQQANVYEGSNNIAVNQLSKLLPGMYIMQISENENLSVTRFIIGQ